MLRRPLYNKFKSLSDCGVLCGRKFMCHNRTWSNMQEAENQKLNMNPIRVLSGDFTDS